MVVVLRQRLIPLPQANLKPVAIPLGISLSQQHQSGSLLSAVASGLAHFLGFSDAGDLTWDFAHAKQIL